MLGLILFIIVLILLYLVIRGIISAVLGIIAVLGSVIAIIIVIRSILVNIGRIKSRGVFSIINILIDLIRVFFFYDMYYTYSECYGYSLWPGDLVGCAVDFVAFVIIGGILFLVAEIISFSTGLVDTDRATAGSGVLINFIASSVFCIIAAWLLMHSTGSVFGYLIW